MNAVLLSLALAYTGEVEAFLSERPSCVTGNFTVTHFNQVGDFFKKQVTIAADYVSETSLQRCHQEGDALRDHTEGQRMFNIEQASRATASKLKHRIHNDGDEKTTAVRGCACEHEATTVNSSIRGALASHLHCNFDVTTGTNSDAVGTHCHRMHSAACKRAVVMGQLAEQLKAWIGPMRDEDDHLHKSSTGSNIDLNIATTTPSPPRKDVKEDTQPPSKSNTLEHIEAAAEEVSLAATAATAPRPETPNEDFEKSILFSGEHGPSSFNAAISGFACVVACISIAALGATLAGVIPEIVTGRPVQERYLDIALQEVLGYPSLGRIFVRSGGESVIDGFCEGWDIITLEHMRKIVRVVDVELFVVILSSTTAVFFDDSGSVLRCVVNLLLAIVFRVSSIVLMSLVPPVVLFATVLAAQWTGIVMLQTNMWTPNGAMEGEQPSEMGDLETVQGTVSVTELPVEPPAVVPLTVRHHLSPINEDEDEDWETLEHEDAMEEQEPVQQVLEADDDDDDVAATADNEAQPQVQQQEQ